MRVVSVVLLLMMWASVGWSQDHAGIGASYRIQGGQFRVASVFPDGPAAKSGELEEGDAIVAIGEGESEMVETAGKSVDEVTRLLRGVAGSEIRLKVVPAKAGAVLFKMLALTREAVEVPKEVARAPLNAGKEAPDISFVHLDSGEEQRLSDFRGKVVVIDFWATWCAPCQEPMTKMQQYAADHPDWGDEVLLMGLSIDRRRAAVQPHIKRRGWDKTYNCWSRREAQKAFNVTGVPHVFIIDQQGRIAASGHPVTMNIPAIVDQLLADAEEAAQDEPGAL